VAPPRTNSHRHRLRIVIKHTKITIATGVTYDAWTFDGRVPGPVLRVTEGDTVDFTLADRHATLAAASTTGCTGCHVRADCLECHRPSAARGAGYHPDGFLARHPASAYAREASCSDCHNVGVFCSSCHARAGLVASGVLRSGYHDARPFFLVGHGQAARQGLESCVSCHAERDCLTCHSAVGGRRFNPHGPGFDGARMRRKNFAMCTVCHGAAVP